MRIALCVALAIVLGCVGPVLGQDIILKTLKKNKVDVLKTPPEEKEKANLTDPSDKKETTNPTDPTEVEEMINSSDISEAKEKVPSAQHPQEKEEGSAPDPSKENKDEDLADDDKADAAKEKFFLHSFRTLLNTEVSLITSTVFSSCLWDISSGNNCMGRRKKRAVISPSVEGIRIPQESSTLESSSQTSPAQVKEGDEDAKFAFTVWTAVSTTTTITTIWTNPSFTVSLSYQCSVGFLDVPINICNGG